MTSQPPTHHTPARWRAKAAVAAAVALGAATLPAVAASPASADTGDPVPYSVVVFRDPDNIQL